MNRLSSIVAVRHARALMVVGTVAAVAAVAGGAAPTPAGAHVAHASWLKASMAKTAGSTTLRLGAGAPGGSVVKTSVPSHLLRRARAGRVGSLAVTYSGRRRAQRWPLRLAS